MRSDTNGTFVLGQRSNGTLASPTATLLNQGLMAIAGGGFNGTDWVNQKGQIDIQADGNWSETSNPTRINFFTTPSGSTTLTERMRLDNAGNVGIGTTGPADVLDVSKNTSGGVGGRIVVSNRNGPVIGNSAEIGFKTSSDFGAGYYSGRIASIMERITEPASYSSGMAFYTYKASTSAGDEVMRLTSDGNVGIGEVSPGSKLSVLGGVAIGSTTAFSQAVVASGNLAIQGNVGIGTTAPGVALQVNGGVSIATLGGSGSASHLLCVQQNSPATGYNYISDCGASLRALKTDIQPISDGLSTLMQLEPVQYKWTSTDEPDIGFIAEDVQKISPTYLTSYNTDGSLYGVNYLHFSAVLTKAIQEMNLNLEAVAGTITPLPGSRSESFVTAFLSNIYNKIGIWLADAGNGIQDFFANRVRTKELCVSDDSGETCITKMQLDALLGNAGSVSAPATSAVDVLVPSLSAPAAPTPDVSATPPTTENLEPPAEIIPPPAEPPPEVPAPEPPATSAEGN
jgi:hypothetical protein